MKKGHGDFSQRINGLAKKLESCKLIFNKNTIFLRKKIFSKDLNNSPDLELTCEKEKEVTQLLDKVINIIKDFDNIYKKIK